MVLGFAILLVCQLLGEVSAHVLALPVPGPVLGLVLLVGVLHVLGRGPGGGAAATAAVMRVADGLLANLALLFVPAGVGIVQYGSLLEAQAAAIGVTLLISTLLTLFVTVAVFVGVARLFPPTSSASSLDVAPR